MRIDAHTAVVDRVVVPDQRRTAQVLAHCAEVRGADRAGTHLPPRPEDIDAIRQGLSQRAQVRRVAPPVVLGRREQEVRHVAQCAQPHEQLVGHGRLPARGLGPLTRSGRKILRKVVEQETEAADPDPSQLEDLRPHGLDLPPVGEAEVHGTQPVDEPDARPSGASRQPLEAGELVGWVRVAPSLPVERVVLGGVDVDVEAVPRQEGDHARAGGPAPWRSVEPLDDAQQTALGGRRRPSPVSRHGYRRTAPSRLSRSCTAAISTSCTADPSRAASAAVTPAA